MALFVFPFLMLVSFGWSANQKRRPNIIFMLADDIGFNELGFHECTTTQTPFIDALATKESLILRHHYVSNLCSPTRAAFLSGRYPHSLGLQHFDSLGLQTQIPVSLTRQVSTISEELRKGGYSTHIIGYGLMERMNVNMNINLNLTANGI